MRLILCESNIPNLSWDFINDNIRWVVKFCGYREVGNHDIIDMLIDDDEVRDIDLCAVQPIELKPFFEPYYYAVDVLGRRDLFVIKDFYNEWVKDTSAFEPDAGFKSGLDYESGLIQ